MEIKGFRGWDWAPEYVAAIPNTFAGMPSVEPTVLERPGGFATFGPSRIAEMTIPVEFIYQSHEIVSPLSYEEAYRYLFKRLQPFNDVPGELRAELENGDLLRTLAVMRVYGFSSFDEGDVNTRRIDFVSASGWETVTPVTLVATF